MGGGVVKPIIVQAGGDLSQSVECMQRTATEAGQYVVSGQAFLL